MRASLIVVFAVPSSRSPTPPCSGLGIARESDTRPELQRGEIANLQLCRHRRIFSQGYSHINPPFFPSNLSISRQHFLKFANLYLKVGYVLGGFQELNSINFEIVREEMFGDGHDENKKSPDEHENDVYEDEEIELSDDEEPLEEQVKKPNLLSRFSKWFLSIFDINRYKK